MTTGEKNSDYMHGLFVVAMEGSVGVALEQHSDGK